MPLRNCYGQAVLETLVSLPAIITMLTLVFGAAHGHWSEHLLDSWTYEAAFCLLKEKPQNQCQKQYLDRIAIIPFIHIESFNLTRGRFESQVSLTVKTPLTGKLHFNESLSNNFTSDDFRRAQ